MFEVINRNPQGRPLTSLQLTRDEKNFSTKNTFVKIPVEIAHNSLDAGDLLMLIQIIFIIITTLMVLTCLWGHL